MKPDEYEWGELQDRIQELRLILSRTQPALGADDGTKLRISGCNGSQRYYIRHGKKDKYGSYVTVDQMETIQGIAQQNYDVQAAKRAAKELKYLENFLKHYPDNVVDDLYLHLSPARQQLVNPAILPDDEFVRQWESVTWDPLPFRPNDETEYFNKKGVRMKSKQETIMSNYFIDRGVPQRYEFPINLKGMGEVHPDFMLLNKRTRKEYYWEHFGLWDKSDYMKNAVRKLVAYQRTGIYIGEQLIVTFETSTYHPGLYDINQLIDHYLI